MVTLINLITLKIGILVYQVIKINYTNRLPITLKAKPMVDGDYLK